MPAGHAEHSPGPVSLLIVPAGQSRHDPDPMLSLYLPASHAVQGPRIGPVYPAMHVQSRVGRSTPVEVRSGHKAQLEEDEEVPLWYDPAGHTRHSTAPAWVLNVPSGHAAQRCDPDSGLYLPASQAVHAPPSGPLYPALQVQCAARKLWAWELLLCGQGEQTAAVEDPLWNVPGPHTEHAPSPASSLKAPLSQSLHAAEPRSVLYVPASHR